MMELGAFRGDVLNRTATRAAVDGIFTADAFMEEASELLVAAGEVDYLDLMSFSGLGRRRQSLAVHGFAHDEQDRSVALVVRRFEGGASVPSLSYSEAVSALKSLENFLAEALSGHFLTDREPATLEYQLAQTLRELKDRGDKRAEERITRCRLYLVTDAELSARARALEPSSVDDIPIEFHIWDMQRFLQIHESSQGREPLELQLADWGVDGVPALQVKDASRDITTYLAAVPGGLLANLYRQHGSRLLEGNVRSFLTIRGKINKGIRETVVQEPGHFLAYNNGISATASGVEYRQGALTSITDLQIVNGGQTTASLFYATQANKELLLDDVFVQMKLVVVTPEDAAEMVPRISRYANSQNAVREDDFFSNSPFHVKMEELSKRVLAPAKSGLNYQTKWYYERTRGQYLNERNRRSPAEQKKFEAEFPQRQLITKTDAAKYVVSWEQQPHLVSAGAQKNFKAFAAVVAERFAKDPAPFNENYYKRLASKAILFNSVRAAIAKADWYEAGYLANLTAYAVAKLAQEIEREPRAAQFDLLTVWERQEVGSATLAEAVNIARKALDVLTADDRLVVNVTEWAKRDAAWQRFAQRRHTLSEAFLGECIPMKLNLLGERAVTINSRFDPSLEAWLHVEDIDAATWRDVRTFLSERSSLNSLEARTLQLLSSDRRTVLDNSGARVALGAYVTALNHGWKGPDASRAR